MSRKTTKVSEATSKGTVPSRRSLAKRPVAAPRAVGGSSGAATKRASPSRSGNTPGSVTEVFPLRLDLPVRPRSKLTSCHVCRLPSVLQEWRVVKSKKGNTEHVSVPSQGPETQPHIKRWCAGSCMAIMAVMWMTHTDLEDASGKLISPEAKKFAAFVRKQFNSLTKEVKLDLKIRGRNRDFTGVR